MISGIYNSDRILYRCGKRKGKTRKELQKDIDNRIKLENKKKKQIKTKWKN